MRTEVRDRRKTCGNTKQVRYGTRAHSHISNQQPVYVWQQQQAKMGNNASRMSSTGPSKSKPKPTSTKTFPRKKNVDFIRETVRFLLTVGGVQLATTDIGNSKRRVEALHRTGELVDTRHNTWIKIGKEKVEVTNHTIATDPVRHCSRVTLKNALIAYVDCEENNFANYYPGLYIQNKPIFNGFRELLQEFPE